MHSATVVIMTTTDDVAPIRVSGPAGLLAAVPPMLGFHPSDSLVLMCLSGQRRRVGPVARVDLPPGHDRRLARHLTGHAQRHADEVVVICYQSTRRRAPLLDDLLRELKRAGIEVMDAFVVVGDRARPAMTAAVERGHSGYPVPLADDPQVQALTAAGALAGRSVLADREQLRQSIAGPSGERLQLADWHVDQAAAGVLQPSTPPTSLPTADSTSATTMPELVEALLDRAFAQVQQDGVVKVEQAAALAVVLDDAFVRDAVLRRAVAELDEPWVPMLISCATWTPDPLAASVCSVLAVAAYRHGDGALAQIAVDRTLAAEPENPLAHLMIAIMSAGLRPEVLEQMAVHDFPDIDEPDDGDAPDDNLC
jgi:hypothetical protein